MVQNDQALLTRLRDNRVDFVVIGGVCGIYHGVPIATFDLDVACQFDEFTLTMIEKSVRDLHPFHRLTPNRIPFELTPALISGLKNVYLQTDLGKVDCLGEVSGVGNYEQVLKRSILARLSFGEFRFLDLDALIDAKTAVGRDRDLRALAHLRAIKERIGNRPESGKTDQP
jgi:hypothetical protein